MARAQGKHREFCLNRSVATLGQCYDEAVEPSKLTGMKNLNQ